MNKVLSTISREIKKRKETKNVPASVKESAKTFLELMLKTKRLRPAQTSNHNLGSKSNLNSKFVFIGKILMAKEDLRIKRANLLTRFYLGGPTL